MKITPFLFMSAFFLIWMGTSGPLRAQNQADNWQISYVGETIWHSGVGLGFEQEFQPTFLRKRDSRHWKWGTQFSYFSHRTVHRSLLAQARLGYYLSIQDQWQLGSLLGLGLRRYWLASPTLVQSGEGFTQQTGAGGWQILPGIGGEVRWIPSEKRNFFLRPWLMQGFPHNAGSLSMIFLEIGFSQSLPK